MVLLNPKHSVDCTKIDLAPHGQNLTVYGLMVSHGDNHLSKSGADINAPDEYGYCEPRMLLVEKIERTPIRHLTSPQKIPSQKDNHLGRTEQIKTHNSVRQGRHSFDPYPAERPGKKHLHSHGLNTPSSFKSK